jgi:hypothetical protein
MKITAKQKIGIPILSLLLAFSILAFQHHENHSESSDLKNNESSVIDANSLDQNTLKNTSDNDTNSN